MVERACSDGVQLEAGGGDHHEWSDHQSNRPPMKALTNVRTNKRARKSVAHTLNGAQAMINSAARRDEHTLGNPTALDAQSDVLERTNSHAVATLRAQGITWAQIANAVGSTRQAAWQRWGNS